MCRDRTRDPTVKKHEEDRRALYGRQAKPIARGCVDLRSIPDRAHNARSGTGSGILAHARPAHHSRRDHHHLLLERAGWHVGVLRVRTAEFSSETRPSATAGFAPHFPVGVVCKSLTYNDLCNFWAAANLGLESTSPDRRGPRENAAALGHQPRAHKLPF